LKILLSHGGCAGEGEVVQAARCRSSQEK
jgi:hypothetical protein